MEKARSAYRAEFERCNKKQNKKNDLKEAEIECNRKNTTYRSRGGGTNGAPADLWKWDDAKGTCVNLAESKSPPTGDDCSHASLYSNSPLKGQNCKAAMETIEGIKARNTALNDSSQAIAGGYASMQTMQATGQQGDAQTRQQNIMKMLAVAKMVNGGAQLQGAMELKNAASGAEGANSAITSAQKNLSQICANQPDEQACFYQNAPKVGIEASAASYASYENMKRAAQQSQDQANTANQLAKSSLVTGLADTLVGIQAWKMAQQAQQNAADMGAIPGVVAPPPPASYNFSGGSGTSAPGVGQSAPSGPTDFGTQGDGGLTMGNQANAPIRGTLMAGKSYAPNSFKPASSGISSGGGGGGGGGFSGIKGGKDNPRRGRKGASDVGAYSMSGGLAGYKGGGSGPEKGHEGANPLAEMLAKMFPQDKDGKPVVDARALASQGNLPADQEQPSGEDVTAAEATIFEQVSAKYHQLNFSGRI